MKSILILLAVLCFNKSFSQDTVYLVAKLPFIATVKEMGENYVILVRTDNKDPKPEKIEKSELRKIKFKGGYTEVFRSDTIARIDKIVLVDNSSFKGTVMEINQYNVIAEINNGDSIITLPLDSMSSITFSNGYVENYHPSRKPPVEKKMEPIRPKKENITLNETVAVKNEKHVKQEVNPGENSNEKSQESKSSIVPYSRSVREEKSSTTEKTVVAVADKKIKQNKKSKNRHYTLNDIGTHSLLGIGLIIDSATGLSRSFAFYEMFKNNPLIINNDTLYPVIVDYQFNVNYAIRGYSTDQHFAIKISKNGSKYREINTVNNWSAIYNEISSVIAEGQGNGKFKKVKNIDEGSVDDVNSRKIKDCMPGTIETEIPRNSIIDTFRRYVNIKYYNSPDSYETLKKLYGKYHTSDENSLFFFRNDNIPSNLKNAVKPLVFPLSNSLMPCLTYLSTARALEDDEDMGASLNSLFSALNTSNKILASAYEKALIRAVTFSEISKVHIGISGVRRQTSLLFKLGADLNRAYLLSGDAREARDKYYESIATIEKLSSEAEEKAFQIRRQNRFGAVLAVASAAASISTVNAYDNTLSNSLMDQAGTYLTSSMESGNKISAALREQFRDIDDKIDTKDVTTNEDTKVELGKSYLASEVGFYLLSNKNLVKEVLYTYASDKPALQSLLDKYYDQNSAENLRNILVHITDIEKNILNFEVRNMAVPVNITSTF